MNSFGEFLYALRKEKGMTQAELANLLGITNKAVSKWETGEAMPETSLLVPLSKIFQVSVDELLNGSRAQSANNDSAPKSNENSDGNSYEKLQINYCDKTRHIFTKEKPEKTFLEIICGIVCACILFISVTAYLLIGFLSDKWTPYWIMIPLSALLCGVVGCVFDLCNEKKRNEKIQRGENPFVGALCAIVMLSCFTVYLILGAALSLWHPLWMIILAGAFLCALIGAFGELFRNK